MTAPTIRPGHSALPPLPKRRRNDPSISRIKPGEVADYPCKPEDRRNVQNSLCAVARYYRKRYGWLFKTEQRDGGVAVYRVK